MQARPHMGAAGGLMAFAAVGGTAAVVAPLVTLSGKGHGMKDHNVMRLLGSQIQQDRLGFAMHPLGLK